MEINFRTNEMEESRFCNLVTLHFKSFTAWTCLGSDAGFKGYQSKGVLKQRQHRFYAIPDCPVFQFWRQRAKFVSEYCR